MEKGKLYLIATPIGNLDDITLRAIKTIESVDIIAAEDTRQTGKLLKHLNISKPMIIYHRHNEDTKKDELVNLLNDGKNIGVITDAGTPGISDPGEVLVKRVIEEGIQVIPIPGACALINALIASGLNTREFAFYGFISNDNKLRDNTFNDMKRQNKTIILYEAPHRLLKILEDIKSHFGDIYIVVAKELTKIHETFIRGNVSEFLFLFSRIAPFNIPVITSFIGKWMNALFILMGFAYALACLGLKETLHDESLSEDIP